MKGLTIIATVCIVFTGCVQVGPKIMPEQKCPELKAPPAPKCPTLSVPQCTKYSMPGIAQTVTMKIRGDVVEECDTGCELMIREYAKAQQLLR